MKYVVIKYYGEYMKKTIFLFILIFISVIFLFPQNWFIGGGINFQYGTEELINFSEKKIDFSISPLIGYKINKFDFGIIPTFDFTRIETDNMGVDSTRIYLGFGLGVFSGYSLLIINNFSVLGRLNIGYTYFANIYERDYIHSIRLSLSPEFQYHLLNNLVIYATIGLLAVDYLYYSERNKKNFDISIPFSKSITDISLGFYIIF